VSRLQLRLRHGLENPGTNLIIRDFQIQHDLGDLPKGMDVPGQSFTM
jgi:hypothetical protein